MTTAKTALLKLIKYATFDFLECLNGLEMLHRRFGDICCSCLISTILTSPVHSPVQVLYRPMKGVK